MNIRLSSIDVLRKLIMSSPLANSDLKMSAEIYSYNAHVGFPLRYFYEDSTEVEVTFLAHEMGHAIDFLIRGKVDRLTMNSFGFEYTTQVEVFGQYYDEPKTTQGIHSECRATAYEIHILQLLGFDINVREYITCFAKIVTELLKDSVMIPKRRSVTRHAESMCSASEYQQEVGEMSWKDVNDLYRTYWAAFKQDRIEYAMKHIVKHYNSVTPEDITNAWHEVIGIQVAMDN